MLRLEARASLFPTEDPEKVRQALLNIFPDGTIELVDEEMILRAEQMDRFKQTIRSLRILDSTRNAMRHGISGNSTSFSLNKQAAYAGKVSQAEGAPPLGNINVWIEADDIEKAIDVIAPQTVNGEEI
jgi:predicted RNA binding protein with dsRBD fold (UPF0201 family)